MASLLTPDWFGENVVGIAQRAMAADAFVRERCAFSVRFQVRSPPSRPAPTYRVPVFFAVSNHELDLKERSRPGDSLLVCPLEPRDLGKGSSVRPRVDVIFCDGFDSDFIAKNFPHCAVVGSFRAADGFPILIVGDKSDTVGHGLRNRTYILALNPFVVLCLCGSDCVRRSCCVWF